MTDRYGTYAGFVAYCVARNHSHAVYNETDADAARLVASEYLDASYRSSFPGLKVDGRAQVREWPRTGACDVYGYTVSSAYVPAEVEHATYELMHRELDAQGSLSVDFTPSKYKRVAVDGAVSVEYSNVTDAGELQTKMPIVDQILAPLLVNRMAGGLSGKALRA